MRVARSAVAGAALFAHRALLFTWDHVPFSEVYQVSQLEILP